MPRDVITCKGEKTTCKKSESQQSTCIYHPLQHQHCKCQSLASCDGIFLASGLATCRKSVCTTKSMRERVFISSTFHGGT